ncbi:hypothetical protein ABN584_06265 [Gloeocapsa sp. BRSZ]
MTIPIKKYFNGERSLLQAHHTLTTTTLNKTPATSRLAARQVGQQHS